MTGFYKNVFPILVEKGIPQASTFLKSLRCIRAFPNQFVIISGADCRNRESSDWVLPLGWTDLFNPAPTHSFKRTFTEFLQHQWIALSWILHCYSSCTFINVELH